MAAASLRNVEIAAAAAEVADAGAGDDNKNNSNRHTSCSGHSNQHTYHQQEHEQPKKRNIYHQTANCHYHNGASILFWLAVILVLGELKTGKFSFVFLHSSGWKRVRARMALCVSPYLGFVPGERRPLEDIIQRMHKTVREPDKTHQMDEMKFHRGTGSSSRSRIFMNLLFLLVLI